MQIQRIGYFGHSSCAYRSEDSHLDLLANHFKSDIVNTGVRQGSEERILFELKKTKNLDLAIIFHSEPQFIFLPECDRDIGLNNISESRIQYLFSEFDNEFTRQHHSKFTAKFNNTETLSKSLRDYKEYFYDPDLQVNRFYGSLIQIDQYCVSKNISVIHIIEKNKIPSWFKFSSGIIDDQVMDIVKQNSISPNSWFVNCITKEGNFLIFQRIKELVESLTPSPGGLAQLGEHQL